MYNPDVLLGYIVGMVVASVIWSVFFYFITKKRP